MPTNRVERGFFMINLPALNDEDIASFGDDLSKLWMVRLNDQEFGPYEEESLKTYATQNPELFEDADVTQIQNEAWMMFLQSPLKTHAKKVAPTLVSSETLQDNGHYFLENNGQRLGPMTHDEIVQKIKSGALKTTDLVSSDDCLTWSKLYHLEALAEYCQPNSDLPLPILSDTLHKSHDEALAALMEGDNPLQEGLVSLAHYGHQRQSTTLKLYEIEMRQKVEKTVTHMKKNWWVGYSASAAVVLSLLVWWAKAPTSDTTSDSVASYQQNENRSVEVSPARKRLLQAPTTAPRQVARRPASVKPLPQLQAQPNYRTRRDLQDYRDADQYDRDIPEPVEPMDAIEADPYGANGQYAHEQRDPYELREPASLPIDDGYRLEATDPHQPIIEEVGDF
jgi:hypothetical protein